MYLGIDAFNFQCKLFEHHLKHLNTTYNMINNRLYGDYYKIYKAAKIYIEASCKSIKIIDVSFQTYKDLQLDKTYNINDIVKLQEYIQHYIKNINDRVVKKRHKIQRFIDSNMEGYNVKYYINEETTNINMSVEKINLYIKYLETCDLHHNKYLSNFINQINKFISSIKDDIHINNNEIIKKELFIDKSFQTNFNKELINKDNQTSTEDFDIRPSIAEFVNTLIDAVFCESFKTIPRKPELEPQSEFEPEPESESEAESGSEPELETNRIKLSINPLANSQNIVQLTITDTD